MLVEVEMRSGQVTYKQAIPDNEKGSGGGDDYYDEKMP